MGAERNDYPECIKEGRRAVWHLARPYVDEDDAEKAYWRGVACSGNEGILLPGPAVRRQPTCVPCYEAWRMEPVNDDQKG